MGDAISSFDEKHKIKWEHNSKSKFREFFIKTITIQEIFDIFGYQFDFINLDVEALNFEIIKRLINFVPQMKSLKLVCIEHDNKIEEIKTLFDTFHFKEIHRNNENLILGK